MERVKREIFQSQAFDIVRNAVGGPESFSKLIDQKIEAVDGDIVSGLCFTIFRLMRG